MRRLGSLCLVLVLVWPCLSDHALAQAQRTVKVSGHVVDAGRRPVTHERVELLFDGTVVDSTASGRRGEWSFGEVRAGEYVVRVMAQCQSVGRRVSVVSDQDVDDVEIVMPSASRCCGCCCGAPAPVAGAAGRPPWLVPVAIGAAETAVAVTVLVVTAS